MMKKKKYKYKKEPWMLMDEYHLKRIVNPLCAGCRNDCKQRTAFELECEQYTPTEPEKEQTAQSE